MGRNGYFYTDELTDEQLEELCLLEYRASKALSYIVVMVRSTYNVFLFSVLKGYFIQYFVGVQLVSFILISAWLFSTSGYDDLFKGQGRPLSKTW